MSTSNTREEALGKRVMNNFKQGLSAKRVAKSKPFTFIVGPEETEFTIHSAVVARQSPVLNVLVNGPCKEALERRVTLSHVDEFIFMSFWEFAYTGDYESPKEKDDTNSESEDTTSEEADDDLNFWSKVWLHYARLVPRIEDPVERDKTKKKKMLKKTSKQLLWEDFVHSWAPKFRPLDEPWVDPDTLMHHAKVCAFADCYYIDDLLELSLNKLFIALEGTIVWGNAFDNIMDLLVFCSGKFVPDKLRRIVAHYIICHMEVLQHKEEFQSFLMNPGCSMKSAMDEVVFGLLRKGLPIDRHAFYGVPGASLLADQCPC
ncbi:hypothetical protein IL306_005807 [Fusarium sp. DS 682]|nr:hypothetical protein IL306_005807 [Fusarium sp. DS 682]